MDEGLGFPNKDFSMLGSILRFPPCWETPTLDA